MGENHHSSVGHEKCNAGSSAGRSSTARSVRQSASQESSRSMRSQSDRNSRRNHGSQAAAPKTGPQPNADEEFRYKNAPGAWFDESFAAYSEHPYVMQPMPMQAPHLGQPCMQHHEMLNMGQPFQAQVQQAHLQQAHMQQAQQARLCGFRFCSCCLFRLLPCVERTHVHSNLESLMPSWLQCKTDLRWRDLWLSCGAHAGAAPANPAANAAAATANAAKSDAASSPDAA